MQLIFLSLIILQDRWCLVLKILSACDDERPEFLKIAFDR